MERLCLGITLNSFFKSKSPMRKVKLAPLAWSPLEPPLKHQRFIVMSRCAECVQQSSSCSCRCAWCQDAICAACRMGAVPKLHRDVMSVVSDEAAAQMPVLCLRCDTEYYRVECKCIQCHKCYDEPCIENPQVCHLCKVPCCASCIASAEKSVADERCLAVIVCSDCESKLKESDKRFTYYYRSVMTAESVLPNRQYGFVRSLIDGAVNCENISSEDEK